MKKDDVGWLHDCCEQNSTGKKVRAEAKQPRIRQESVVRCSLRNEPNPPHPYPQTPLYPNSPVPKLQTPTSPNTSSPTIPYTRKRKLPRPQLYPIGCSPRVVSTLPEGPGAWVVVPSAARSSRWPPTGAPRWRQRRCGARACCADRTVSSWKAGKNEPAGGGGKGGSFTYRDRHHLVQHLGSLATRPTPSE